MTPDVGIPIPGPFTPNGIVAGYFLDKTAGADPERNMRHIILHNSARARGKTSVGIAVLTDGALVRNNHVVTEGGEARAISVAGSNAYIGQNRIEGAGAYALHLAPFAPMAASRNEVIGNELGGFKASVVDVALETGANDNIVAGSGAMTDLRSGNQIRGLKLVPR